MVVGVVEAARLAGCSRQTIWRKLKSGELSAAVTTDGAHRLDTAELLRVFGTLQPAQPLQAVPVQPPAQPAATPEVVAVYQARVTDLERDLERARAELDAERTERRALTAKLMDLNDRYVRLLTDQRANVKTPPSPPASTGNAATAPRLRRPRPARQRGATAAESPSLSQALTGALSSWLGQR